MKEIPTMSCIRLNLSDHEQTISGEVHGSIGDAAVAALSAKPETIHELELALARFVRRISDSSAFAPLHQGENFEPYDAGIVIIDLAARVVMIDSTYSAPAPIVEACSDDFAEQLDLDVEQDSLLASDEAGEYDAEQIGTSGAEQDSPTIYGIFYHDGEK